MFPQILLIRLVGRGVNQWYLPCRQKSLVQGGDHSLLSLQMDITEQKYFSEF